MSETVESLDIKINATAKSAKDEITNLVGKIDVLTSSLSKINGSNLSGLANGVSKLGNATKTLSGVKATDYNRIAKGFERFAKIDVGGLSRTASGLNTLANGLNNLGNIQNLGGITSAVNAVKNLSKVNMAGFDTSKMTKIATSVSNLATKLSGVSEIESTVTRVVGSLARLSNSGQYIGNVTTEFPELGKQVVKLVRKLSSANAIDISITKVVEGIAKLANAGKRVGETVANLKKLGEGVINLLKKLQNAPQINSNVANTIQGLGNLASSGSRISTVSDRASTSTKKLGNALSSLKDKLKSAHKSSKGFVSSIGMFYAKFFLVIRAVKKFGQAIGSAQDYIEEFNYFSVALDKVGKDSANQFKKAGYNSAEEYAGSFRKRFGKLQKQLTGYDVDYNTGDATNTFSHNLGLDLTEVMNYNAAIAQITNSAGMLGETSIATSKALTMLSADWASLANLDTADVMQNFQSGLVGQSRALYKYGIDITSAGLAQTALNHGINVSISELNQQSKMQLRALTMLEQSKVAYGDLARTINQPANQLRMLRAGFHNLARTIGSLFMPIVQKLYPYLNAVVMVLQDFAQWIAKLAGIKLGDISGSVKTPEMPETPDYSDAVDDSGKVADNMDKTAKKAKKASDNLQTFDKVNKLQGNDSDTDTGAGNGKPNNTSLDLSKELADALGNYENKLNNAFKNNKNKAVELYKKMKKAILDAWKDGDFSGIGKILANKLNNSLAKIPWAKIKATTKKIAKSIATFLNGFIKNTNWKLVGKTLADGFNTVVDTLYTFVTTFDWLTLGTSISDAINSAVKNADFKKAGKLLGAQLRGVIQFAFGLITNLNYKQLGKKIGDAINGFLEDMGRVDSRTGLTGWQELGKTISDGVKGILDTIYTALSTVNWGEVGKAIGDFLGQIDWIGIFVRLGKVIAKALFSALKVGISAFANDPLGVAGTLATVLASVFAYKKLKMLWASLKTVFGNGISNSLLSAKINTSGLTGKFSVIGTKIGKAIGIAAAAVVVTEIVSSIGKDNIEDKIKKGTLYEKNGNGSTKPSNSTVFDMTLSSLDDPEMWSSLFSGKLTDYTSRKWKELAKENNKADDERIEKNQKEKIKKHTGLSSKVEQDEYENATNQFMSKMKKFGASQGEISNIVKVQANRLKGDISTLDDVKKSYNKFVNKQKKNNKNVKMSESEIQFSTASDSYYKGIEKLQNKMKKLGISEEKRKTIVNKLSDAVNKGVVSESKFASITSKSYKTSKELSSAVDSVGKKAKTSNIDIAKFNVIETKLASSLSLSNVSTKTQNKYMLELKKAYKEGNLSLDSYKKIAEKTYNTQDELNDAISKYAGKKVTATITANVSGLKSVSDLESAMTKMSNKKISGYIKYNPKLRKDWYKSVQKELYSRTFSINANTKVIKASGKEVEKATKSQTGKKYDGEKFKKLMNTVGTTQDQWGQVVIPKTKKAQMSKKWKTLIKFLKKNGIATNNPILFANGGFPEDGWFRASHGEMMGKFDNGKSVVANNKQITTGISEAVAPAVYAATKAAIKEELSNANVGGGDVYLDGTKVTTEIMSNAKRISKSKGITWRMA